MFGQLEQINSRPAPFEFYTAADLWTDDHTSRRMLAFHLDDRVDVSSRNAVFIDRSVAWIESHLGAGAGVKIADFGCGPGLYTTRLARKGAEMTGIDFSRRSLAHARAAAEREGLAVRYEHCDYLEFETEDRFDLILMIMCDFCALSPAQRQLMLAKFHGLLSPAGAVLLDVYSLIGFGQREEGTSYAVNLLDGFWAPERYHGFLTTFKYAEEKVTLDKYTIVEPHRTRTVYNWLQYFSPPALEEEFGRAGFTVERWLGDVAGAPFDAGSGEFAVVVRRP